MASDNNIKKVQLEIGGEILRSKTWEEIDGYFETTEVGLGTYSTEYTIEDCDIDANLGIPQFVQEDAATWNHLNSSNVGTQRNTSPNFTFPDSFASNEPHYCDFEITNVETIGQAFTADGVPDADGDIGNMTSNQNIWTNNQYMSDMRTYETGNPFYDEFSDTPVSLTWEFKPGAMNVVGNVWVGMEYISEAFPGGGKSIWKFTCKKSNDSKANFRSPGPRGEYYEDFNFIYQGVSEWGMEANPTFFSPDWYSWNTIGYEEDFAVTIANENIASGAYGVVGNAYPGEFLNDLEIPFQNGVVERYRAGYESVQGRTLYLYPTNRSPYKHPIIFDIFEGIEDALWVRGSSNGILNWISDLVKRQAVEDNGPGVSDEVSAGFVGLDMEALNYTIPEDEVFLYTFNDNIADYWPPGVPISVDGFFSTYRCYISPYLHSGLWSYNQTALGGNNNNGSGIKYREEPGQIAEQSNTGLPNPLETSGGITYLKQDISPVHAIGSSVVPVDIDYYQDQLEYNYQGNPFPKNPGAIVTPTYNQYRRLGWRSACIAAGSSDEGQASKWALDSGCSIEFRVTELENCEIWILSDYHTYEEKNVLFNLSTYMDSWENGDQVENAATFAQLQSGWYLQQEDNLQNAPLLEEALQSSENVAFTGYVATNNSLGSSNFYGGAMLGDNTRDLMVARKIKSVGTCRTCIPRAYSPFTENAGGQLGKGGKFMSSALMKRHWKEIMTVNCVCWTNEPTYVTELIQCEPGDPCYDIGSGETWVTVQTYISQWGWRDFAMPYIEFAEEDHAPASHWEFIHIQPIDPTLPVSCEINGFKVYKSQFDFNVEMTEDTELQTEFIVTSNVEETVTQMRDVWEQLDVLDRESVPLSLNFSVGDLRDPSKRSGGFSKTFEIPASPHNERVIGNLSGPGRFRDGDTVKWRKGRIKSGGVEVFRGFVRIEGFASNSGGRYKCHIVEDPAGWPTLIGDGTMCTLSDENGGIGGQTQFQKIAINMLFNNGNSEPNGGPWRGNYYTNGEFSPGDGSFNLDQNPSAEQKFAIFPPINYGEWNVANNGWCINSQSIHPAIHVRYLLNLIFSSIGYTLESKWMDNPVEQFNGDAPDWVGTHSTMSRLVIPYTSGEDYTNNTNATGEDGNYKVKAGRSEMIYLANHYENYSNMTADSGDRFSSFPEFIEETDVMNCYNELVEPPNTPSGNGNSTYGDGYGNQNSPPWGSVAGGYTVQFSGRYRVMFKCQVSPYKPQTMSPCFNGSEIIANWMVKNPGNSYRPLYAGNGGLMSSINPSTVTNNFTDNESNLNNGTGASGSDIGSPFNTTQNAYTQGAFGGSYGRKIQFNGNSNPWPLENSSIPGDWESWKNIELDMDIDLGEGQIIKIGFWGRNKCAGEDLFMRMRNAELLIYPLANTAPPEMPVSFSKALGCGVKQMDIIKGVTEMFNLHWTADGETKTVYAEPYDEFYGSGKVLDWSDKLDADSWEDLYIIDEAAREVFFKYKSDGGDGMIKDYESEDFENNDPLWSIMIENEAVFNKVDVEEKGTNVFASTMQFLVNPASSGDASWPATGTPDMPVIWPNREHPTTGELPSQEWLVNSTRPPGEYPGNRFHLRCLSYFGILPESFGDFGLATASMYASLSAGYNIPYVGTQNYYAGAGKDYHSLSWDDVPGTIIEEVGGECYDANNNVVPCTEEKTVYSLGLFSKHWRNQYEKITGKGTLRICHFNLNDNDIKTFDYRDIVKLYFDHVATYWTVNKIIDYKPGAGELTKVELVEYNLQADQSSNVSIYKNQEINSIKKPKSITRKAPKPEVYNTISGPGLKCRKGSANNQHDIEFRSKKSLKGKGLTKETVPFSIKKNGEVCVRGGEVQAEIDVGGNLLLSDIYVEVTGWGHDRVTGEKKDVVLRTEKLYLK